MPEASKLYKIGEVSRITATKAFVLRYWETEFPMLRPAKSDKGQRLYREQDVATVLEIRRLLYEEGFTIAGARKHLKENGAARAGSAKRQPDFAPATKITGDPPGRSYNAKAQRALREARDELRAILKLLDEDH